MPTDELKNPAADPTPQPAPVPTPPKPVTIPPEIGRTLYFYPSKAIPLPGSPGPLAAKIVHVHGPNMVNLIVWDSNGCAQPTTSVELIQPGQSDPTHGGHFCRWMPYQVENAERAVKFAAMRDDFARVAGNVKTEAAKAGMNEITTAMAAAGPGPGKDRGPQTISTLPTAPEPARGNAANQDPPHGTGLGEMEAPPKPAEQPPRNPWLKPPG